MIEIPIGCSAAGHLGCHGLSAGREGREIGRVNNIMPINYVALSKNDSVSWDLRILVSCRRLIVSCNGSW